MKCHTLHFREHGVTIMRIYREEHKKTRILSLNFKLAEAGRPVRTMLFLGWILWTGEEASYVSILTGLLDHGKYGKTLWSPLQAIRFQERLCLHFR